jgi:hypothetical protein
MPEEDQRDAGESVLGKREICMLAHAAWRLRGLWNLLNYAGRVPP